MGEQYLTTRHVENSYRRRQAKYLMHRWLDDKYPLLLPFMNNEVGTAKLYFRCDDSFENYDVEEKVHDFIFWCEDDRYIVHIIDSRNCHRNKEYDQTRLKHALQEVENDTSIFAIYVVEAGDILEQWDMKENKCINPYFLIKPIYTK